MATAIAEHGLKEKLASYKQDHILQCLDLMPAAEQKALLQDLSEINYAQLAARYQTYLRSLSAGSGEKVFDTAEILASILTGRKSAWTYLWLIPLRDALNLALWFAAWGNTVRWRDKRFRLKRDGRMQAI